ncbi:MAG: A24 family peptidase [Pseudomonadota bacterium]|nr:A24 family peptidase [Pseudomonadota bacterium]
MLELLSSQPITLITLAVVLGLLIGSFLNVVIHRVPIMLEREWREQCAWLDGGEPAAAQVAPYDLVKPRSACPRCGHQITWYENIPILSWLFLRGRCSACGMAITARYPLVEALTGLLFGYVAWRWGATWATPAICLLLASLIALAFIDLDTRLLPDNITLPLAWAGLLFNLDGGLVPLPEAVIGAIAGYLSLWSVYHLFKLITGKEGMGFGDFKLLAALGAWLGWKMLLPILLAASFSGAIVGIGLILFAGHDRAKPIPFGPWLVLGGLIALFWGDELLRIWLG